MSLRFEGKFIITRNNKFMITRNFAKLSRVDWLTLAFNCCFALFPYHTQYVVDLILSIILSCTSHIVPCVELKVREKQSYFGNTYLSRMQLILKCRYLSVLCVQLILIHCKLLH